ncbi:MAG: hypothetical protein ACPLRW_06700 [Moorellales bacterium]
MHSLGEYIREARERDVRAARILGVRQLPPEPVFGTLKMSRIDRRFLERHPEIKPGAVTPFTKLRVEE